VESGGPKRFLMTSASFECTAQRQSFPRPNLTQDVLGILTHFQASQARSLVLCGKQRALFQPDIFVFRNCLPPTAPISTPRASSKPEKASYPMVCSGQERVRWLQSYALRGLFGHVYLRPVTLGQFTLQFKPAIQGY